MPEPSGACQERWRGTRFPLPVALKARPPVPARAAPVRPRRLGQTLDQTLATAALTQDAGYEVMWIPFLVNFDRDSVIRSAWEEAAGVVEPVELP